MAKKFNNKKLEQNSKEEKIEVEGKVIEVLKGSDYLVELQRRKIRSRMKSSWSIKRWRLLSRATKWIYCKSLRFW